MPQTENKPFFRWKNILRIIGSTVSIFGIVSVALPFEAPSTPIFGMDLPYYFVVLLAGIVIGLLPTLWEAADRADTKNLADLIKAWRGRGNDGPGGV